jgi:Ni/Fe-hydrogenase subunit HybB-like protein
VERLARAAVLLALELDSVLLEVALCIMSYTFVLWIELSPAFLERAEQSGSGR